MQVLQKVMRIIVSLGFCEIVQISVEANISNVGSAGRFFRMVDFFDFFFFFFFLFFQIFLRLFRMVVRADFLSFLLFLNSGRLGKTMGVKVEMELVVEAVVEMGVKVV